MRMQNINNVWKISQVQGLLSAWLQSLPDDLILFKPNSSCLYVRLTSQMFKAVPVNNLISLLSLNFCSWVLLLSCYWQVAEEDFHSLTNLFEPWNVFVIYSVAGIECKIFLLDLSVHFKMPELLVERHKHSFVSHFSKLFH